VISSKEILDKTGISRASLNNYIGLGLLPKPIIMNPSAVGGPRQLGYFPDSSIEQVRRIQQLKREGTNMAKIVSMISGNAAAIQENSSVSSDATPPKSANPDSHEVLRVTVEEFVHPAYMINQNFEVVWFNKGAKAQFFDSFPCLPATSRERNIFQLIAMGGDLLRCRTLIDFLLSLAKRRYSPETFVNLCQGLSADDSVRLRQRFNKIEVVADGPVADTLIEIQHKIQATEQFKTYASFFREGILMVFTPATNESESILDMLSRRDEVIRTLLRHRLPVLTQIAVLVTDLQGSVRICSELPPEEYFELINEMWGLMGNIFRKYHGTCGKHVGDGMVYFFFPQPDSDYLENALLCAMEIKKEMLKFSKTWQLKKNWLNELYLNTGITEGQEWLGTFQSSSSFEFVVLGETINQAARISDFARFGSIWATKSLIGKIPSEIRSKMRYGIRRRTSEGQEHFISSSFSMVSTFIEQDNSKSDKLKDIATLSITEVMEINEGT
jgi:class 3 adenylate cyclase/predicted DNA-binding transcriptional regulator AlpA